MIAFLFVSIAAELQVVERSNIYIYCSLIISIILFALVIYYIWKLIGVLTEAKELIDSEKENDSREMVQTLRSISKQQELLKKIYLEINSQKIDGKEGRIIDLNIEKENKLKIIVHNSEKRMIKNIEIGIEIPYDFIIDEKTKYQIWSEKEIQIARYNLDYIHDNTALHISPLIIKPLKRNRYKIKTFMKGENIESNYREVVFSVK